MTSLRPSCWLAACLVASAGLGSVKAGEVARYSPKPGQVLTYEENQTFEGSGEKSAYRTTWKIWAVGKNDDGSCRMVVRESMKTLDAKRGVWNDAMPAAFACFDLNPDGTVRRTPLLGTRFAPLHLFPRLPVNEKEAAGGWQAHDERDDATTQYEAARTKAKADGPTIDFVADQSTTRRRSTKERIGARFTLIAAKAWWFGPRLNSNSVPTSTARVRGRSNSSRSRRWSPASWQRFAMT